MFPGCPGAPSAPGNPGNLVYRNILNENITHKYIVVNKQMIMI